MGAAHAELLREMRVALLAEFGARAIYRALARSAGEGELAAVLGRLAQDEEQQIEGLRGVMASLGARPARRSLRRTVLARLLAATRPLIGLRLVLRICASAQEKASRWYAHFQTYLLTRGLAEAAARCGELSLTKRRHAQVLQTWVQLAAR